MSDSILLTITLKYSCDGCKLHLVPIEVPAREEEDPVEWMGMVQRLISADHVRRSPMCKAATLSELWIPNNGQKVGGSTVQ